MLYISIHNMYFFLVLAINFIIASPLRFSIIKKHQSLFSNHYDDLYYDQWGHGEVLWDLNEIQMDKKEPSSTITYPKINNLLLVEEEQNITELAIYSGMMQMLQLEVLNKDEILMQIQDTIYTDMDKRSFTNSDLFTILFVQLLSLNHQIYQLNEANVIRRIYTKKNNIKEYYKIKKISTYMFLILYTILGRNIYNAE